MHKSNVMDALKSNHSSLQSEVANTCLLIRVHVHVGDISIEVATHLALFLQINHIFKFNFELIRCFKIRTKFAFSSSPPPKKKNLSAEYTCF